MLDYLRNPFPKGEGFSPYRMPGRLVHYPVLFIFAAVGGWLCCFNRWTVPLLLVWIGSGVYFGRDLAILAHYHYRFLIMGGVNLCLIVVLRLLRSTLDNADKRFQPPEISVTLLISLLLAGFFAWYARKGGIFSFFEDD